MFLESGYCAPSGHGIQLHLFTWQFSFFSLGKQQLIAWSDRLKGLNRLFFTLVKCKLLLQKYRKCFSEITTWWFLPSLSYTKWSFHLQHSLHGFVWCSFGYFLSCTFNGLNTALTLLFQSSLFQVNWLAAAYVAWSQGHESSFSCIRWTFMLWAVCSGQKLSLPVFIGCSKFTSSEVWCDITQQETSLQGETMDTCKLNWNKNKHQGESCYSSATSKLHTRPLRPESIFVVMTETPQFPLLIKCNWCVFHSHQSDIMVHVKVQQRDEQLHIPCLFRIFTP